MGGQGRVSPFSIPSPSSVPDENKRGACPHSGRVSPGPHREGRREGVGEKAVPGEAEGMGGTEEDTAPNPNRVMGRYVATVFHLSGE